MVQRVSLTVFGTVCHQRTDNRIGAGAAAAMGEATERGGATSVLPHGRRNTRHAIAGGACESHVICMTCGHRVLFLDDNSNAAMHF